MRTPALLLLLSVPTVTASDGLGVTTFSDSFGFNVTVDDAVYFHGASAFVVDSGKIFSTSDGSLFLAATGTSKDSGKDELGAFQRVTYPLSTLAHAGVLLEASVRVYADQRTVIFQQVFPSGLADGPAVSVDGDGVGSGFPSFVADNGQAADEYANAAAMRGVLSYTGRFVEGSRAGLWSSGRGHENGPDMGTGLGGGPFAVFDDPRGAGDAVAVSHLENFMAASFDIVSQATAPTQQQQKQQQCVASGLLGSLTSVPAGFSVSTVLVLGRKGVSSAFKALGDRLLQYHGKDVAAARAQDMSLHSLGYDTVSE
jgi:hypothetical protein